MSSPKTVQRPPASRVTAPSVLASSGPPLGRLEDFDFPLPPDLIAQHPPAERAASRLLRVDPAGDLIDTRVRALPALLRPGDLLVFNDTRVLKARLRGRKDSGGQIEILVERIVDDAQALAQIRASHAPREGSRIRLDNGAALVVVGREGGFFRLRTEGDADFARLLDSCGELPLPPYIERAPETQDEARYQTVFAAHPGAVAAPTAGLHFDAPLLAQLRQRGIATAFLTLHVGAGTFQPVRVSNLDEHRMHRERYFLTQDLVDAVAATRTAGGKVVAVGTTSLRALESAALDGPLRAGQGETELFIRPGYRFRVVDRLMTNFHLPRSTLLMLVSAFAGHELMLRAYAHAVQARYRFFSYGDAMLLDRADPGAGHAL